MKKTSLIRHALHLGVLAAWVWAAPLPAATFEVNVSDLVLYTDPNTGNEVHVGGFSGLYPVPGDPCRFYVVTDRGPTYDYIRMDYTVDPPVPTEEFSAFLDPEFGPNIITVHLLPNGTAEVENIMPLVNAAGGLITGLPNTAPSGIVDVNLNELPSDADALDAEGLTMDPWGNFWVSEEYRPSVAMVAPDGTVLARLVPSGTLTGNEQVPTYDILPGILARRVNNRGLEGLAMAANGLLYAIMQRPLANPDKATSEASRNIRIVAIDVRAVLQGNGKNPVRQYLYRTDLVDRGDYASDIFSVTPSTFLVSERKADKLYSINVSKATDITPYETADGTLKSDPSQTIEMLDDAGLAALKIKCVRKKMVLESLKAIDPSLSKVEGICQVGRYIVLTADNDFNLGATTVDELDPFVPPIVVNLQDPINLPKIHVVPLPRGFAASGGPIHRQPPRRH